MRYLIPPPIQASIINFPHPLASPPSYLLEITNAHRDILLIIMCGNCLLDLYPESQTIICQLYRLFGGQRLFCSPPPPPPTKLLGDMDIIIKGASVLDRRELIRFTSVTYCTSQLTSQRACQYCCCIHRHSVKGQSYTILSQ